MASAKVTIDISPIFDAVVGILNRAGAEWLQASQEEAPVRKANTSSVEPGSRSSTFPVRQIHASNMTLGQKRLKRSLGTARSTRAASVAALQGYEARNEMAQLFRYAAGPLKGQTPELLVAGKGGKLAGAEVTRGGTLKAGLEIVPAVREGNLVTVVLQNKVPYAAPMEYGFDHKGGSHVKERRFMRGPRDNLILPGLREGRYNRG